VTGIGGQPADAADFPGGVLPTGSVTFAAGETSQTITIDVNGDTIAENDETFAVTLADPTGATITTATARGTIVNDDTNLGIIAINADQIEGNSGSKSFTFAIQRTGVLSGTSTTSWAAAGSGITPADASDFAGGILPSGTVTFAPGEASKLISVDINGDTQIETDETFSVTLYDSSEVISQNPTATGTIISDEPITISLGVQPSNALEDSGNPLTYTFTRNGSTDAPLTINFLVSGSADPSTDYTANCDLSNFPLGIITFNAGDSAATLDISPITDATIEGDETIEIELLASSDYAIGTVGPVVAIIINDDAASTWTRLLGSNAVDSAYALTTGSDGSIYIGGQTFGNLDGQTNSGYSDAFISKFNPDGRKAWTRLLGSYHIDHASALTTGSDGSIYIGGFNLSGNLDGQVNIGGGRSFISKFNPDGSKAWTQLLGTPYGYDADALTTGNDGSIYIGGTTNGNLDGQINSGGGDAFISKLNPDGSKAWTRLLGSGSWDWANALTTGNDGSIYIGGFTSGNLDGQINSGGLFDAFISKFNPDGSKAWTQLLGTPSDDRVTALTTGSDGSIYIGGSTYGNLDGQTNSGSYDAFISKFNPDGSKAWTQLLGTGSYDSASALTTGSDGSIYIGGSTSGNLDGQINSGGSYDAFISKFNPDGSKAWTRLLGSSSYGHALTTGSDGFIYIGGITYGNLDGQINSGDGDAFISKFNPDGIGHTYLALVITATDVTKPEGNNGSITYTFTVNRSGNTSGVSSTAQWTVNSAQATGNDFVGGVLPSGTVTFAAGEASKLITVEMNGHSNLETDKSFTITLTNPAGATINNATAYSNQNDVPVPCLAPGTLILTPSGNRPVEELQIGDLVLTPDGPQPLKFLGISTRHVNNLKATGRMPIRIQAGVFGHNLPSADIYCTPSHAFALGDCLVEAQALINGESIYQLEELSEYDQRSQGEQGSPLAEHKEADSFIYYSLEFEQHVLAWANDLLTESYLSTYRNGELTRLAWNNYDNYLSLYGSSKTMDELPMPRIPFSRQLPLRIREQFGLLSSYHPSSAGISGSSASSADAGRDELCLTL
jgi:uncharacterized delta-60 repeat protein